MKKFSSTTRVNSRRTSPIKKRIGLIVIIGLLALFLLWVVPKAFAQVAAIIFVPIEVTRTWLFESSGSLPQYLRDRATLIEENETLKEQLALDNSSDRYAELMRQENEELRALLGGTSEERILASIIGRPNALPYDVLVIDRGSNDGIALDAPVFIADNRVIGIVSKVFAKSAIIELVTTPNLVSSVFVVGPDIFTNAVGMGGGQLRIGVPQGIALTIGDAVILPAVQSGVFGSINHIESLPTRPEQYAYVSTDIPLQSLRFVSVARTPLQSVSFEEAQAVVNDGLSTLFSVPVPEGVLVLPGSTSTATSTATTTDIDVEVNTPTTTVEL